MPLFSYKALTMTGETADGLETADSIEQLREILSSRDLILKAGRVSRGSPSLGRPPLKHIANFNRELTVLLRAGISIPESLSLLAVRPGQPRLEKALQVVAAGVKRGASLSDAMGKAPAVFDAPYRALVATGEQAGALPVCLERYQDYVDLKQKVGSQVSKAMIYPIVLLVVLSGVLTFLFVEVIPNFVSMYAELGSSLPAPTQVLIGVEENFPFIALTIGGTLCSVWLLDRLWTSKPEGAIARDKALLRVPVFGHFRRASAAAATARMLSILISSGATVPKALDVASSSVSDRYFSQVLSKANRNVKDGERLTKALTEGGLFRAIALKMIQAGEASGSLDKMLTAVAAQQEDELATSLARLTGLMEPAVLLLAGVLVGGVVIAMYLPIFTLTDPHQVTPQTAARLGLPFDDLAGARIPPEALARLPAADARRLGVAPLRSEGDLLVVATSRPDDFELEQKLSLLCRCEIDFVVSPPDAIDDVLKRCGDGQKMLEEMGAEFGLALVRETEQGNSETIDLEAFGGDAAPVVRLVNEIVRAALQRQASDIHIHSDAAGVSVDFRVDGVLMRALGPFDPAHQATLISRIKVMADLDIAEHRIPQDGRFRLRGRQGDIDFRVSVLPGVHGEDIVIRVLDKAHLTEKRKTLSLEALGYEEKDRTILARVGRSPNGMLLVTGPTGSGKTTTLYACLSEFCNSEEKVITIEDPVEYELPGILQIPVAEKKGLTFARGLRSILRHDPDKIMVGEIRDRETASIAVQAALTGHLVFTTLHANNAFDVISRFTHMEIDLYELVAALNCIVAQRLLRRLCPVCSRPHKYTFDEIAALGLDDFSLAAETWREPGRCESRFNTGYSGRTVAAEILLLTPEIKQMIVDRQPTEKMRMAALQNGLRDMRQAALGKARSFVTSLPEVVRVT